MDPTTQCLPVAGSVGDLNLPPATAEEYLLRVRNEAAALPDVMAARVDSDSFDCYRQTSYMPQLPSLAAPPSAHVLPDRTWERALVSGFVSLRQQIVRLSSQKPDLVRIPVPRMRDSAAWRIFCFGIKGKTVGTPPILRLLLQFDQVLTRELLRHHVSWLEESEDCEGGCGLHIDHHDCGGDACSTTSVNKERNTASARKFGSADSGLSPSASAWLFAILARLDKPVAPDIASTLRQLLRHCCGLRARLAQARATEESTHLLVTGTDHGGACGNNDDSCEDSSGQNTRLACLNVLIVIVAKVFGQGGGEEDSGLVVRDNTGVDSQANADR